MRLFITFEGKAERSGEKCRGLWRVSLNCDSPANMTLLMLIVAMTSASVDAHFCDVPLYHNPGQSCLLIYFSFDLTN